MSPAPASIRGQPLLPGLLLLTLVFWAVGLQGTPAATPSHRPVEAESAGSAVALPRLEHLGLLLAEEAALVRALEVESKDAPGGLRYRPETARNAVGRGVEEARLQQVRGDLARLTEAHLRGMQSGLALTRPLSLEDRLADWARRNPGTALPAQILSELEATFLADRASHLCSLREVRDAVDRALEALALDLDASPAGARP